MKAMLLAGGLGMRLRPLTETTPKCLIEVGGKPLLQYRLEALAATSVRRVVINLAWLGERIEAWLGSGSRFGLEVRYAREAEPTRPLGNGGAVLNALPLLGESEFIVVNSDIWTDYPLADLIARPLPDGDLAHLALAPPPTGAAGDFHLSADGRVGMPKSGEAALTFCGISRLSPALFAGCERPRVDLGDLLREAARQGRVGGRRYDGEWMDVGTHAALQTLRARLGL